jgi:exonuclease III
MMRNSKALLMLSRSIIGWFIIFTVFRLGSVDAEASIRFRVASYNVENLFDLETQGTEYPGYVPGSSQGWGPECFDIKISNIAKVIIDINADVVALEEVESLLALKALQQRLKHLGKDYGYSVIAEKGKQAVGCAMLSRFEIVSHRDIPVAKGKGRSIVRTVLRIDGQPFIVYINHWKSKRSAESKRVVYAESLKKDLDGISGGADYIVVGDLNSNYNEYQTFLNDHHLNDTGGMTGINMILRTVFNGTLVERKRLQSAECSGCLYNLWLEIPDQERWSYIFRDQKLTLDHIMIPQALFDGKGVTYVEHSFGRFAPEYLVTGNIVHRWRMEIGQNGEKTGSGYSDHIPVYADFLTE